MADPSDETAVTRGELKQAIRLINEYTNALVLYTATGIADQLSRDPAAYDNGSEQRLRTAAAALEAAFGAMADPLDGD